MREVQFDGLVGPTHNYGGLSPGNVASAAHEGEASNPRAAVLQGLNTTLLSDIKGGTLLAKTTTRRSHRQPSTAGAAAH